MIPDYLGPGQDLDPMSHTILPCNEKNVGPKKCWSKIILSPKLFWTKKVLDQKKIGPQKIVGPKKFGSEKLWVQKI